MSKKCFKNLKSSQAKTFYSSDKKNLINKKEQARNVANARERTRMKILSKAFLKLKATLHWVPADTKLSRLDTLRLAISYISHLRQILKQDCSQHKLLHSSNLTWPFSVDYLI